MIIQSKDIFSAPTGPFSSGRPFLNENQLGALSISSTFLADKKTLMNWIKRTAEAIGILRQISMDIITKLHFVSIDEKRSGRPSKNKGRDNVARAEKFARDENLKTQLRAAVIEDAALGDSYLWKKGLNEGEKNKIVRETLKEFGLGTEFKAFADEDPIGQRTLQYIASSTMEILIDSSGTKIDSFIQRTGLNVGSGITPTGFRNQPIGTTLGRVRKWQPDQIIHHKFMSMDGKVHGFTPMQSIFPIMKTLGAVKDYHGHYFEAGVLPDIFFNFEEMDANSPAHERMRQVLQEWYNNKRRAPVVTTGKFSVERINEWNKDMEFRLLTIYYTGVMAFAMGMPLEKIRAILGGEIKSTTGGSDIGNTDYQRNISDMQDDWEDLLNAQFFNEEFQVDIKIDRSAARDEIAEVQRNAQKLNNFQQFMDMDLIKKEHQVDLIEKMFPDMPSKYWNENPQPMEMGPMIPSSQALKGPASQALSDQKKAEQKPQQKNNPPTGIKELFEVSLERFKDEVRQEKITPESRNKVEISEQGNTIVYYLTPIGINKTFITKVPKSEVTNVDKFVFSPISKVVKKELLFEVSLERFKDEVRQEKITPESRNKVEVSEEGDEIVYYLTPIGINKTYVTRIRKSEVTNADKFIFSPISKLGKRVK